MADVRVLVVADDPLVRGGLAALLADYPGVAVVGHAEADDDLTHAAETYGAELLVWDLGSAPAAAIDRLSAAGGAMPPTVALLSDRTAARRAWSAGARGLLHRDVTPARLAAALAAVAEGAVVLDDAFADALLGRGDPRGAPIEPLTPRELAVLRLLAEGHANKAIAARLEVSENTVKFHVNAIFGKLGAGSRTEAVTRATRMGLVPL